MKLKDEKATVSETLAIVIKDKKGRVRETRTIHPKRKAPK